MKVSSPIGDFPFEARRLTVEGGHLVVEGSMGAWPARVEVSRDDIPGLLRLVPAPIIAALVGIGLAIVARLVLGGAEPPKRTGR